MCAKAEMLHDHRESDRIAVVAAAIANADEVRQAPAPGTPARCLLCGCGTGLSIVVVFKTASVGPTEAGGCSVLGVCTSCREAASETRAAAVSELAQAAARAEALLSLIRHRAGRELSGWWGVIGAATQGDVDAASVAVRRAIERVDAR